MCYGACKECTEARGHANTLLQKFNISPQTPCAELSPELLKEKPFYETVAALDDTVREKVTVGNSPPFRTLYKDYATIARIGTARHLQKDS